MLQYVRGVKGQLGESILFKHLCIRYFSVVKYHDQKQPVKEFVLAHSSRERRVHHA